MSFHSGIRLSIGQPSCDWQNGTPQSMQRAPWLRRCSSEGCVKISRKSAVRSLASRYGTLFFGYSMKPVGLPMLQTVRLSAARLDRERAGLVAQRLLDFLVVPLALGEHTLVVGGHHLHELLDRHRPLVEDLRRDGRARVFLVQLDHLAQLDDVLVLFDGLEVDGARVALRGEVLVHVPDVRDAARHAGREVETSRAQDHRAAAGHVLAAVVADALDHGLRAAVAHAEPLGRAPAEERAAARRAVERDVADQHVVLGRDRALLRRIDDDPAARFVLTIGNSLRVFLRCSIDFFAAAIRRLSSARLSPWSCFLVQYTSVDSCGLRAGSSSGERSRPCAFQWSTAARVWSRSTRPIRSTKRRTPRLAITWRASSATMNR